MKNLIVITSLFMLSYVAQAQSMLSYFALDVNKGKVLISWTIKSGSICNGVDILRSADGQTFDKIGDIPGVCGEIGSPKSYSYTDDAPILNAINYYRLDLGGQELSEILQIEVLDIPENDYLLRPNPFVDTAGIFFTNDNQNTVRLTVYNLNGRLVYQDAGNSSVFLLDADDFKHGAHYFFLENETQDEVIRGKFVVGK